jgi:hypothetical protein
MQMAPETGKLALFRNPAKEGRTHKLIRLQTGENLNDD